MDENVIGKGDSYPSFEVWLLSHFCLPKGSYHNQDSVISDLRKYIEDYSKDIEHLHKQSYYSKLFPLTDNAIANAKQLETAAQGRKDFTLTHIYKMIEDIVNKEC